MEPLIISAYNEQDVIREKLENTLALDYPKEKLEVIVASEAADGTNAVVREYAGRGIILHAFEDREGKPATLYRTVPLARGEMIVFSDANAMYHRDAIRKLVRNFADPRGMRERQAHLREPRGVGHRPGGNGLLGVRVSPVKEMLSRIMKLSGGVNGSIFAIRKSLYLPVDRYRGDDFELSNRIQIAGHGVILEPEALSFEGGLCHLAPGIPAQGEACHLEPAEHNHPDARSPEPKSVPHGLHPLLPPLPEVHNAPVAPGPFC